MVTCATEDCCSRKDQDRRKHGGLGLTYGDAATGNQSYFNSENHFYYSFSLVQHQSFQFSFNFVYNDRFNF